MNYVTILMTAVSSWNDFVGIQVQLMLGSGLCQLKPAGGGCLGREMWSAQSDFLSTDMHRWSGRTLWPLSPSTRTFLHEVATSGPHVMCRWSGWTARTHFSCCTLQGPQASPRVFCTQQVSLIVIEANQAVSSQCMACSQARACGTQQVCTASSFCLLGRGSHHGESALGAAWPRLSAHFRGAQQTVCNTCSRSVVLTPGRGRNVCHNRAQQPATSARRAHRTCLAPLSIVIISIGCPLGPFWGGGGGGGTCLAPVRISMSCLPCFGLSCLERALK